jgi:conjugal transfer/entry exclusion protein
LELSRDQQNKFYPLYEEMEDQINKINDDARSMEKRVGEMTNPSDLEYEKATEAMYDSAVRCAQLERDYMDKFQNILSRKQLFKLKSVERKFSREVMKQHNRLRSKAKTASDK